MGYRALIQRQVRSAFSKLKDLAVDVTLSRSSPTTFNFSTMAAGVSAPTSTVVKGVVTEVKRKDNRDGKSQNTKISELILITADVADFTDFDTITIGGILWKPSLPYLDNGYTITVEIVRG